MTFFRSLLLFVPAACLLAQTPPPPQPAQPAQQRPPVPITVAPAEQAVPNVPPDKVIITVGDQKITAGEFNQIADALPEQSRAMAKGSARGQFADYLVRVIALAQEARRQKLDQTPSYKLAAQFQTESTLANMLYEQINKSAKPDEPTLRKYYDEHKSEFEQVHARHILIRMTGSAVPVKPGQKDLTEAEALAKVQELRKRILAGEDFAKLATTESDDAGTGPKGGDLGTFGHGQMVPTFEQTAFALKPGEMSEPVKTQFGYHLIKVESREAKTFEDVRPELERKLGPEQAKKAVEDLVKNSKATLDPEYFPPAK